MNNEGRERGDNGREQICVKGDQRERNMGTRMKMEKKKITETKF